MKAYRTIRFLAWGLFCFQAFTLLAQPFSNSGINLPGGGEFAWGDYNNDGLPDALFLGSPFQLLRNSGGTNFVAVNSGLPAIQCIAAAWGDYNNDNLLDVAFSGWDGTNFSSGIFRNNGDGTFTDIHAGLPAQINALAWGDFDNDGQLDLLVNDNDGTDVFRNDHGAFSAAHAGLPAFGFTRDCLADYNRDGWLDILAEYNGTTIFQNNHDGTFTNINANMPGVFAGFAAWGDLDNDGYPDVAITGSTNYGPEARLSEIYHNNHDGTFSSINSGLYPLNYSGVAWGDYDNDGWADVVESGTTNYGGSFWDPILIYHNNGNGSFASSPLELGWGNGNLNWVDYDGDKALDLLALDTLNRPTLYHNGTAKKDTPPTAPAGLLATPLFNNDVQLRWSPASDAETTNAAGLCYNLRMGTSPGAVDIISPEASLATGQRRLNGQGNASSTNAWLIKNLPRGTYYWSVQAIDPSFVGGAFSAESVFTITNARPQVSAIGNLATSHAFPTAVVPFTVSDFETAATNLLLTAQSSDTNVIPNPAIVLGGAGSNRTVQVFPVLNHVGAATITITAQDEAGFTGSTAFVLQVTNAAPTISTIANLKVDMNSSTPPIPFAIGDLETPASNLVVRAASGNTTIVPAENIVFGGSNSNRTVTVAPAFGTFGSVTITVTALDSLGTNTSDSFTLTVTNQPPTLSPIPDQFALPGQPVPPVLFTVGDQETPASNLVITVSSSVTGLVPSTNIVVTGTGTNRTMTITPTTSLPGRTLITINVNDGASGFTSGYFVLNIENPTISRDALPTLTNSSAAWGDYNNDGLLDLLLAGRDASLVPLSRIYRNNGDGTFTDIHAGLPDVYGGGAFWTDLNNDGRLDVVLFGTAPPGRQQSDNGGTLISICKNNGDGTFTPVATGLPAIRGGFVVNADYDNDGKDDLLLAGIVQKGGPTMALYHNDGNFSFHAAVTNLPAFVTGSAAWSDYDRDGDLDLAVNGRLSNQNFAFKILRNDGNGVFTDINSAVPASGSLIAWGDYDGDGWPDITEPFPASFMGTRIYRNTGSGTFTNVSVSLPPLSRGVVSWADYDNDGLPDLLMAGYSTNSPLAQIYHNNGDGTFTNSSAVLPGVSDGLSAWGDFNNDNKLDVVLTGGLTRLHTNDSASLNTPPTPPAFPQATVTNSTVIFQWIAATDAQTPSALLTYNLRVGTTPGGQDVLAPNSDLTTGWRRIPATGNAGNGTNWYLNLAPGLYYWSVQAIDAGLAGSLFATENRFYVGPPCFLHIACPGANGLSIQGGAAGGTACLLQYSANLLNWTDYTNITVAANGLFDWRGAVPTGASSCFFRLHAP